MQDLILNKLEFFNDPKFVMDPIKHRYTYDGEGFISVTRFISRFHEPFDQDYWAERDAQKRGLTKEQVLLEWKQTNERSTHIGTSVHNWIENYYNGVYQNLPNDLDIIDRINKFNKIYATHLSKLTPLKFELRIFSKKYKLAGTLDSLFLYRDSLVIVDWKTNKKLTTSNEWGEKLLEPFQEFDKCHLNEYSIQLSLYSLILREVGLNVKVSYLVYIGPDGEAQIHKCQDFTDILQVYLDSQNCEY